VTAARPPAEPAAAPPLPWSYRPLGIRIMAAVMGTLLVGALTFFWVTLPGAVREQFSFGQRVTLIVVFGAMLAFMYGIARSVVRADPDGVRIVNAYRVRRLEWAEIVHVRLQPGDPWAVLDIDDGTTVKAMAIQGSDGRRARLATQRLRRLVDEHSRTARDD
jgi:hypothetical protein